MNLLLLTFHILTPYWVPGCFGQITREYTSLPNVFKSFDEILGTVSPDGVTFFVECFFETRANRSCWFDAHSGQNSFVLRGNQLSISTRTTRRDVFKDFVGMFSMTTRRDVFKDYS